MIQVIVGLCSSIGSQNLFARKGSSAVYEDPFDVGAGGASLTRAAQAGILFSNPALLPYGDGFHRWVGAEPSVLVGKESLSLASELSSGAESDPAALIDTLTKTPLHFGLSNAVSYMNKGFGLAIFNRFEPDLFVRKYGDTGLPQINFQAESYHGAAFSLASLVATRMISLGITGKYLYAAEPNLNLEVTDEAAMSKITSTTGMQSLVEHNTGFGFDVGAILFKQGYNFDLKLALKGDDIGGTKLSGSGTLKEIPASYHAGLAATIHGGVDAIHLAIDYRDVQGAYEEKMFKKVRLSSKFLFKRYVGIGVGLRDGWLAYSGEVDLILLRITAATWTKELGDSPGVDSRKIYSLGIAMGF
ncbi:MAG: hypothetical protein NT027_00925 [Proteobacteria bacterium]|nr:hypothetical protein [Pseudomonadota bacterium]